MAEGVSCKVQAQDKGQEGYLEADLQAPTQNQSLQVAKGNKQENEPLIGAPQIWAPACISRRPSATKWISAPLNISWFLHTVN